MREGLREYRRTMIRAFLNRWGGSAEDLAAAVQTVGLIRSAQIVARLLREEPPEARQMPLWLDEVLSAAIGRICDYESENMPPALESGTLEACRLFIEGMPRESELEFQSLLVLLELSPFVFGPVRARFTALNERDQDIHLQGWERSPVLARKAGFKALKSVIMMGYWTRPETFPFIGYSVASNPGIPKLQRRRWQSRETRST